jgi:hypothetical protein
MEHHRMGLVLKQIGVGVYHNSVGVLDSLIQSVSVPFTRIQEKTACDTFPYISIIFVLIKTKILII